MKTIIFVCKGNTCRSPMAEFIMKELVKKAGLAAKITVKSAGWQAKENKDISSATKEILTKNNIPFAEHKSSRFTAEDYERADYVVGIDNESIDGIKEICGVVADKTRLLLSYAGEERDVYDPFTDGNYAATYEDIFRSCQGLLREVEGVC